MSKHNVEETLDRLAELVQSRSLPARVHTAAEQLMARLASPVRIAVLGVSENGRRSLGTLLDTASQLPGEFPNSSFFDVECDGSEAGLLAAAQSAAKQSDMTIWVEQSFETEFQRSWEALPDDAMDHAFVVLNTANGDPGPHAEKLRSFRRQGFSAVFAFDVTSTLEQLNDGTLYEADSPQRGEFEGLLAALRAHVETGRRADIDGALMFIQRFSGGSGPGRNARPVTRSARRRRATADGAATELPDQGTATQDGRPEERPTGGPDPASPSAAILALIRDHAGALLPNLDDATDVPQAAVMAALSGMLAELNAMLEDAPDLQRMATQAEDMIVLLDLEKTDRAVADAALVMLQLKREFEVALAA